MSNQQLAKTDSVPTDNQFNPQKHLNSQMLPPNQMQLDANQPANYQPDFNYNSIQMQCNPNFADSQHQQLQFNLGNGQSNSPSQPVTILPKSMQMTRNGHSGNNAMVGVNLLNLQKQSLMGGTDFNTVPSHGDIRILD